MRILVDAHVFDGMYQGSRTYIKGLYREVIARRPDWQFFLLARNTDQLKKVFGNPGNITYLKLKSGNKYRRLLLEIPRHIRKNKIDYAHFQYVTPLVKPCKFIVTLHDILFEEQRFRKYFPIGYRKKNGLLFRRAANQADVLLTVSEYSKKKISELYLDGSKPVTVTPNAVEIPPKSSAVNIPNKYGCDRYLLYVSRVEPRKNHIGLLNAFLKLELDRMGYQLVFIGARDIAAPELNSLIKEQWMRLEGRLHFFENIPNADLDAFYRQSEMVVYPSFAEGFGIPPLEGAVYNKQVVCSSATAMAEFDFFRYHVDPGDQTELRKAIKTALNDSDEEYLNRTASHVLNSYNWKRSAQRLISVLENQ